MNSVNFHLPSQIDILHSLGFLNLKIDSYSRLLFCQNDHIRCLMYVGNNHSYWQFTTRNGIRERLELSLVGNCDKLLQSFTPYLISWLLPVLEREVIRRGRGCTGAGFIMPLEL